MTRCPLNSLQRRVRAISVRTEETKHQYSNHCCRHHTVQAWLLQGPPLLWASGALRKKARGLVWRWSNPGPPAMRRTATLFNEADNKNWANYAFHPYCVSPPCTLALQFLELQSLRCFIFPWFYLFILYVYLSKLFIHSPIPKFYSTVSKLTFTFNLLPYLFLYFLTLRRIQDGGGISGSYTNLPPGPVWNYHSIVEKSSWITNWTLAGEKSHNYLLTLTKILLSP